MTCRQCLQGLGLGVAGIAAALLLAGGVAAQTHYETGGRLQSKDPFTDDGFRPVWQQQLEQKAKQDAAKAKKAADDKRAADGKAKSNTQ